MNQHTTKSMREQSKEARFNIFLLMPRASPKGVQQRFRAWKAAFLASRSRNPRRVSAMVNRDQGPRRNNFFMCLISIWAMAWFTCLRKYRASSGSACTHSTQDA